METKESILIIDDDVELLKVLGRSIEKMGYKVLTDAYSASGLSQMTSEKPDILITDLIMESMDGIELLQKAKALNPEIMVIILTGYGK